MSAIEKLAHLFGKYDKEAERFLEYIKREGQHPRTIIDVAPIDHSDESRPE